MKIVKVSFLLMITFLLATSNLHSQTEQINQVLRNNFIDTSPSLDKGIDKGVFEKEGFENHSNQIFKARTFDSTSVVDSVFETSESGSKSKHSYSYDSNGNMTLKLREGSDWINNWRNSYVYDSNGKMTLQTNKLWDGSQWVNYDRQVYSYDTKENLISVLTETWDENLWMLDSRHNYDHD